MSLFGDDDIIYDDDLSDDEFDSSYSPEHYADTENTLLPPRQMTMCLGHEAQEKHLIELYKNDRIPHALIFSGIDGIGKTTFAFRLARFLFKNADQTDSNQDALFAEEEAPQNFTTLDIDKSDPVFTRVASGGYADLLHIEREYDSTKGKKSANLKVDALRKIEPFLRKTSSAGGWRIVIVEDADTMNNNAQNAILKILEEPPEKVLIILIANQIGKLIPTIRSRSQTLSFNPIEAENLKTLLSMNGDANELSAINLELLTAISNGSVGKASEFLNNNGIELWQEMIEKLESAPHWRWSDIHKFADGLGSAAKNEEYLVFKQLFQWLFRQLLFMKAKNSSEFPVFLKSPVLKDMLTTLSLNALISINDTLAEHFARVEFSNLDRKDAVRGAFLVINENLQRS